LQKVSYANTCFRSLGKVFDFIRILKKELMALVD
jgi:hypothetical protein